MPILPAVDVTLVTLSKGLRSLHCARWRACNSSPVGCAHELVRGNQSPGSSGALEQGVAEADCNRRVAAPSRCLWAAEGGLAGAAVRQHGVAAAMSTYATSPMKGRDAVGIAPRRISGQALNVPAQVATTTRRRARSASTPLRTQHLCAQHSLFSRPAASAPCRYRKRATCAAATSSCTGAPPCARARRSGTAASRGCRAPCSASRTRRGCPSRRP